MAYFEATISVHGPRDFIPRLEIVNKISRPLKIYYDNFVAIMTSTLRVLKHIYLEYFVLKEEILKQRVLMKHISINLMIVDPLTNGLSLKTFMEYTENMNTIVNNDC
ncbi:hypothetical protein CR513_56730, partial [Mucuna pruriens]